MKVVGYPDARRFLKRTQATLEANEAANSLMLGICGQLVRHPERIKATPCLKTVEGEGGIILAAVMTPPHNLVVYGHGGDLAGGSRLLVQDLVNARWTVPGVMGPTDVAGCVAGAWTEVTGGEFRLERRHTLYELREVAIPEPERGRLRPAGIADLELVTGWRHAFHTEIFGAADPDESRRAARFRIARGDIYLWEIDGSGVEGAQPVSMAMKTRPTSTGSGVSLVYTPPALRQRGYATACVGELSRVLLGEGRAFCSLFADRANATSNRLYRRIGYRPVVDYNEYVFVQITLTGPDLRAGGEGGNVRDDARGHAFALQLHVLGL